MNKDKLDSALETVNELHGETLRKMDDDKMNTYLSPIKTEGGVYSDDPTIQKIIEERDALKAEVAKYKAIASKAIREQVDVRKDERERCAKISLDTYSDKDRMKYVHDTYTSGFSDCKLKIHRAIMETNND